ncbi:MAG: peptidoglycan D,D-transpeptidase FtsI family protein [Candidatus Pristimantibacillus sp.]
MIRRLAAIAIILTLLMTGCMGRLAWLQLLPSYSHSTFANRGGWKRMSVIQRQRSLVLDTGRGDFIDRYGRPITGETYYTLALFPVNAESRGEEADIKKLAALLGVSESELVKKWDEIREPGFWHKEGEELPYRLTESQLKLLAELRLNGIRELPYRNRYTKQFKAKQAIGYTSQHPEWLQSVYAKEVVKGKRKLTDQVGGSGLEKSLDKLLHGIGETSVSYFVDGNYKPLHGLDMRITQPRNEYYPLQVMTTLDVELQNKVEAYADSQGLKEGAIVVLDVNNGDVVAMVSSPAMNTENLEEGDCKAWANHALKAVPPGSVFKLVTEAAALEAGVTSEKEQFTCNGEYGKYGLSCWKEGGHGTLTLREGLAQSCNIAFATIAERLTGAQLKQTAEALGIGHQVGWHATRPFGPFHEPLRLLGEEEAGQLFVKPAADSTTEEEFLEQVDGGVMVQSGIGQRDVLMTPLQAANLVVTLLNGGRVFEPRLVSEIRYANGQRMVKLDAKRAQKNSGRVSPATAHKLLRGMEAVVDHGTGRSIRQGIWTVAGKSGTADVKRAGARKVHQWFTGYGPVQAPRYAVAVLSKYRTPESSNQATKLFRGVMDIIADSEEPEVR